MRETRLRKIKDFDNFYDNCDSIFTTLRDNDSRVEIFQNEYMLCICPGSRAGRTEKRIVEVFWGARPYEFVSKGNQWKNLTETGATLFFYRNDTGDISIFLYPAKTEYRQPLENHIVLYEWLDPKKLNNEEFIRSLWNDFIAYMEFTSLDGKPTFTQRLRISYLRFFKHLVIDSKWTPTKFSDVTKEISKWALTVGLSGVIIYALTIMTQPKTTVTEIELKETNKHLEKVSKQLDTISLSNQNLKTISITVDSIESKVKQICKNIKKNK
jgi:hypothetical protein